MHPPRPGSPALNPTGFPPPGQLPRQGSPDCLARHMPARTGQHPRERERGLQRGPEIVANWSLPNPGRLTTSVQSTQCRMASQNTRPQRARSSARVSTPCPNTKHAHVHKGDPIHATRAKKNGSSRTCRLQRGPEMGRGARIQRMRNTQRIAYGSALRMAKINTTNTYLAYCSHKLETPSRMNNEMKES